MNSTGYRMLGRSGLPVSPIGLGTMTLGAGRWGADERTSRNILSAYLDAGGNLIDLADIYASGRSEEIVGSFCADAGARDRIVLATKFGWPRDGASPLSGGNGRRNIRVALDGSLKRLRTDFVDLYWMHVWDQTTSPEEVLDSLVDATRVGKILHYGFSNTPIWYVAKVCGLAQAANLPPPAAVQYSYSLVDRGIELDIVLATKTLGLGIVAWGPLGAGLLTGKYDRDSLNKAGQAVQMPQQVSDEAPGSGDRLSGPNPTGGMPFTERNFDIVDALRSVAEEAGRPMAEVALAWLVRRPGVDSILLGASRPGQIEANFKALDLDLADELLERLDTASALEPFNPYTLAMLPRDAIFGQPVSGWHER